ncbi:MAG TPA: putative Ig domain-containing protein [Verrucomicrobiae bacterium]|nr:putative Ig domain-containing protein [Verrucomicrobiae bacterium]
MIVPLIPSILLVAVLTLSMPRASAIPAFPGAEGAGSEARGGRGGDLYFVTTTNNSGAGSLRTGITGATGPRTIIFRVSGNIDLASDLTINRPYITIAGQTAPGDGITLRRRSLRVSSHNIIVRHIRVRPGDLDSNFESDALWVTGSTNVILDHISTSWSVDECLSVTHSTNVTVQWCMISESLRLSQHEKGAHGYGSLLRYGAGELTFHHNLYQHHDSRNPRLGDRIKLDFVNNVIYNWGGRAGYSGEDFGDNPNGFTNYLNYVGNYLVAGPSTGPSSEAFRGGSFNTFIYQSGNFIDNNKNSVVNGVDTGWNMFTSQYTQRETPYPLPPVTAETAAEAYQRVLAFAGNSRKRDAVDTRLIGTVNGHDGRLVDAVGSPAQSSDYVITNINGVNYAFVRGWPVLNSGTLPLDSDNDGIPNYFESALGWNPVVANNNHFNGDGYTDLEWYLNWLAGPNATGGAGRPIQVNLRALAGGLTNILFHSISTTNGTAVLLGDGETVELLTSPNFSGLSQFQFHATNHVDAAGFGPVAVTVLVTNIPNQAPTLQPVTEQIWIGGSTLSVTNVATDPDLPWQNLAFALEAAPAGAAIDTNSGIVTWRPAVADAGTTNVFTVRVFDNGSPSLGATQSFTGIVLPPAQPQLHVAHGDNFDVQWTVTGDAGPDYIIEGSTNLTDWFGVFTNSAPSLPWSWQDSVNEAQRFYRVLLGP